MFDSKTGEQISRELGCGFFFSVIFMKKRGEKIQFSLSGQGLCAWHLSGEQLRELKLRHEHHPLSFSHYNFSERSQRSPIISIRKHFALHLSIFFPPLYSVQTAEPL